MAAMTTAASTAWGSCSNSPVSRRRLTTVNAAATRFASWVRPPELPWTAVLERLPLTTMPPKRPEPRLATPVPASSRRVSMGMPSRTAYVLAAPRPSTKATSNTPAAAPSSSVYCGSEEPGNPTEGRPAGIVPTTLTPCAPRSSTIEAPMPSATTTSADGITGRRRCSPRSPTSARRPTAAVGPSMEGTARSRRHAVSKNRPSGLSTLRRAGTCPIRMVSARPTMKPFSTGSEMKADRKPNRRTPARSPRTPTTRLRVTLTRR